MPWPHFTITAAKPAMRAPSNTTVIPSRVPAIAWAIVMSGCATVPIANAVATAR